MWEKVQLCAFVDLGVKENAEHAKGRMDAINKQITARSIFKMEGCFLLTRGQPCRERSDWDEDNKDAEVMKAKSRAKNVWLPVCHTLLQ